MCIYIYIYTIYIHIHLIVHARISGPSSLMPLTYNMCSVPFKGRCSPVASNAAISAFKSKVCVLLKERVHHQLH